MNKLVSGAIGFSMTLQQGKNYLPDIEDLKNKRIKHIDFCDEVGYDMNGTACSSSANGFLNIMEKNSQTFKIYNFSLSMIKLSVNNGNRPFINKIIDMPNSIIDWNGSNNTTIYLVFWYDEPTVANNIPSAEDKTTYDAFEVISNASSNRRFEFDENRTLYGRMFRNLLFQVGNGTTPKGNTSVGITLAKSSFLTLQKGNFAFFRGVPVYTLSQNSQTWPLRMQNITFDFTNSYIEVSPSSSVTFTPGVSYLIDVEVDDND